MAGPPESIPLLSHDQPAPRPGDDDIDMARPQAKASLSENWPTLSAWVSGQDWHGGSAILLSYCSTQYVFQSRESWAYDRPVHLALLYLVSLALLANLARRFLHSSGQNEDHDLVKDDHDDVGTGSLRKVDSWYRRNHFIKSLGLPASLVPKDYLWLLVVLPIRIVLFRLLVRQSQCLTEPWRLSSLTLMPAYAAGMDWVMSRSQQRQQQSLGEVAGGAVQNYTERRPYALVTFAMLLYVPSISAMRAYSEGPASSSVCPQGNLLPVIQMFAVLIDMRIINAVISLLTYNPANGKRAVPMHSALRLFSIASGYAALLVISHGFVWFTFVPEDRSWTVLIPRKFIPAALKLDLLVCIIATTFVISVTHFGITSTVFNVAASMSFGHYFSQISSFPANGLTTAITAFIVVCAISVFQMYTISASRTALDRSTAKSSRRTRLLLIIFYLFLITFGITVQLRRQGYTSRHPIDKLIADAKAQHQKWRIQARKSTSLPEAVKIYRERYERPPPPGFDKWYEFAIARNSSIIDDFDSIARDLKPFSYLSPRDLRSRTWEAMRNPWNDVTGIIIRDGKASAHPDVRPTHKWMMEGLLSMISKFEQHLPDMDLAFNTNDEPRVNTRFKSPQEEVESRGGVAPSPLSEPFPVRPRSSFSKERAVSWKSSAAGNQASRVIFEHLSFQNIFYSFGTHACWRDPSLQSTFLWDHSQLCASCMEPHSDGVFLSDWKRSNDPCHQPDLAHLHGFYSSPSSFKGTHELYPIFSQSKAPHFDDILYPSAWNYQDKAIYSPSTESPDPPFHNKNSTLFWRGATTEGVSPGNSAWTGFTRQRFHHIANSATSPMALVPLPQNHDTTSPNNEWHYTYLSPSVLQPTLPTDIKFTSPIHRCGDPDCAAQATALAPLVEPSDFQTHWSYKYILDLDGAGFSGRFLPFLQSRSLPFKAALFREWYDDRLQAWAHFVPLDLRGTGFWATLMYFAGWKGRVGGEAVEVKGHENEGQGIAEVGREWSRQVLRKEDMEIYMFRLLLEWGRLTDDGRDEIGLGVEEAERIERSWKGRDRGKGRDG
ncbi:hypothetical protein C1H76_4186 [Elsinoe australis]|uniref:Glycosyl transferase CAP10 domain-containing protein n=1 Tax=Elsinoe australis TaxID=40998 RepID=A0A4U7B2S3_9PEZI|nr:hypothetical protein C1H76_4186 [Elsinoe australis]